MNAVSTLGIDLAKNTFSAHGVDAQGVVTVRRTVSRGEVEGPGTHARWRRGRTIS